MLKGRLGLDTARIPYHDRHGLLWLGRGNLGVRDGTLEFVTAGNAEWEAGRYDVPVQMLTCIVLEPGTTVSHDAFRIAARYGTAFVIAGEGGVRFYASLPAGPDASAIARAQTRRWADPVQRIDAARAMYAWRLGELLPVTDLAALRGIEGSRMKETYRLLAEQHGIPWGGRRYDRAKPEDTDPVNQAVNHASVAVVAAAQVAVAAVGAIPQLGFIHEDSGIALPLDVADLFRDRVTLPCAFEGLKVAQRTGQTIEGTVRRRVGQMLRREQTVARMIDRIKELFPS